jgi:hypothetical protein
MKRTFLPATVPRWCLLLLLLFATPSAAEPRITDLRVVLDGRQALLSFQLAEATGERFLDRVESGLPTGFEIVFELIRQRRWWFDRTLDTNTLQVVAMYDALEREYLVNYKLGGKLIRSRMVTDIEDLKAAMTRFENEPIFHLEGLSPDLRLRVRMRAELGSTTLFSLIPARITTDWVESERFRPPG